MIKREREKRKKGTASPFSSTTPNIRELKRQRVTTEQGTRMRLRAVRVGRYGHQHEALVSRHWKGKGKEREKGRPMVEQP